MPAIVLLGILGIFVVLLLAKPKPPPGARKPPCGRYGDLDGDGWITEKDYKMAGELWGVRVDPLNPVHVAADVNGDGLIDISDIQGIAQYLQGAIDTFPVCGV